MMDTHTQLELVAFICIIQLRSVSPVLAAVCCVWHCARHTGYRTRV